MVVMRTSVGPSCRAPLSPPHVVVIGNQKGGCGKSTFAMHIIVALLKVGKRVASFDLDLNQLTLTRYAKTASGLPRQYGRALTAWPDGLALNIHVDLDPRFSVVRVERASAVQAS
jgi:cellulose biosynthesis protein BcsQ